MPILPNQYDEHAPYALLREAEAGRIGFDQRLLKSLTTRPEATLTDLARFASEVHNDALLDLDEQIFDLFRHFNSPLAIPYYLRQASNSEDGVPDEIVEAFAALGAAAIEPLLAAIEKAEDEQRREFVFLLSTLNAKDDRIAAIFRALLAEDPYEAALCIGLYGDASLKPDVEKAYATMKKSEEHASEAKALKDCLDQLENTERALPDSDFDLFKLYSEKSLPLFEALPEDQVEEYLNCDWPEFRSGAARSLCDEEYNEDTASALLAVAKSDPETGVRAAALRALGFAAIDNVEIRSFLLETLDRKESTPAERAATAIALAENPSGRVHEAIRELYANDETRADALEAMWRTHDIRYCGYIGENLTHTNAAVRRSAVIAVGAYPMTDLAEELVQLFEDPDTREQALFSYALSAPGKTSEKSVKKLFEKIDELAGGLSQSESEAVASALDGRLERDGLEPVFFPNDGEDGEDSDGGEEHEHVHGPGCNHDHEHAAPVEQAKSDKVGRNDPCPCGSGKKYKKCHGAS